MTAYLRIPYYEKRTKLKLIIAGSRSITDFGQLLEAISLSPYQSLVTEIVSGNAKGADLLGERLAREQEIQLAVFPARWEELGPGAGFARNKEMAAYSDALLAVWDSVSRGTSNMIDTMKRMNKPYFVYCPKQFTSFSGNLAILTTFPVIRKAG
jgi:hypothetical protein